MTLEGKQFSHYRILQLIGRGSMGEVYLIEDIQVQRQVAAKVIRIETTHSEQEAISNVLRLFWREATAIARLDHPHILPLYDHGEAFIDGSHIAYLTMPYRPEGSLTSWLRQRARTRHRRQLTMKQAAHVIVQAGQALQYAHDHQVMHLDVKPANFLIRSQSKTDEYPDLLLSDFGISRLVSATSRDSQQVRGTPIYMAPEQWASHPVFASDQYALAIMAYELLTGSPPFQGAPLSVMFAHIHQQPWSVRTLNPLLPSAVDLVLQRALAKEPEKRFPSVTTFAQAFQSAFPILPGERALRVLRLLPTSSTALTEPTHVPAQDERSPLPPAHRRSDHFMTSTARNPQPAQVLPPAQTPLPALDINALPSTTVPYTVLSTQDRASLSTNTPSQTTTAIQKSLTFPFLPILRQSVRLRSPFAAISLVLLLLLLLGTGVFSVYGTITSHGAEHTSNKPAISTLPAKSTQANTTAPIGLGQRWHQRSNTPSGFGAVVWLNSLFMALGDNGTIFTSPDGNTWTSRRSGTTHLLEGVTWSGSLFVIVGDHGTILTSPDGSAWTLRQSGTAQNLYDVEWSRSLFLAVGDNGTVLSSHNGSTWTSQTLSGFPSLYGIVWSGSLFVIVNSNGVLTSPDGSTWTSQLTHDSQAFDGLIWSGSLFVIVGDQGTIMTSHNGNTWTSQHSGTSFDLDDVDWSGSLFVAVGQHGTILTSPNGNTWTPQRSGTSLDLYSVTCARSLFVATAQDGSIFTSP